MVWGQLDRYTQPHSVGEITGKQILLEGMKNSTTPVEGYLAISTGTFVHLPFKLALPLLGIYSKNDISKIIGTVTYGRIFIVSLMVFAGYWKLPECPNTGDWLSKL